MDRPLRPASAPKPPALGRRESRQAIEKLFCWFCAVRATRDAHLFLQKRMRGSGSGAAATRRSCTESSSGDAMTVLALFEHAFHPIQQSFGFRSLGGKRNNGSHGEQPRRSAPKPVGGSPVERRSKQRSPGKWACPYAEKRLWINSGKGYTPVVFRKSAQVIKGNGF